MLSLMPDSSLVHSLVWFEGILTARPERQKTKIKEDFYNLRDILYVSKYEYENKIKKGLSKVWNFDNISVRAVPVNYLCQYI